ncbi:MAG: (Fe-S)-binding protein [Candidatus Bathyarchaeia archaeon]
MTTGALEGPLKGYFGDLEKCVRCGFCRELCPVGDLYPWEANFPRGKVQLLKALAKGNLGVSDYVIDRMYFCTTCGYCSKRCPSGVRTNEAFEAARAAFVALGLRTPGEHLRIVGSVLKLGNPFGEAEEDRERWIPPWLKAGGRAEVLYWAGCMASYRLEETAVSTAKILNAAGLDFITLGRAEGDCGSILIRTGHWREAEKLARENARKFDGLGVEALVTSCPGCFRTFANDYPRLFGIDLERDLGLEILHSSQLFERLLKEGRISASGIDMKVAYHDPCHLGRHMGVYDPPRNTIRGAGAEIIEHSKSRWLASCCGAGGGFRSAHGELSIRQATRRAKQLSDLAVDAIVTACPFCVVNLRRGIEKLGRDMPVYDLPTFLEGAMDGG